MSDQPRPASYLLPDTSIVMPCSAAKAVRTVVFVHGWGGSASSSWHQWQQLLHSSPNERWSAWWNEATLCFFNYQSRRFSISEHTDCLARFLADNCLGQDSTEPLFLVGHSMGAVAIRQLVLDCCERKESPYGLPAVLEVIPTAEIRLFAPAMLGFKPSGFLGYAVGALLEIPLLRPWIAPALDANPIIRQLGPEHPSIKALQKRTEEMARRHGHPGLRAQIVFGEYENVVERGRYIFDETARPIPDKDHNSVCKPNARYLEPLQFVRYGTNYVVAAIAQ